MATTTSSSSANNYPKVDLITNTREKLKDAIREMNTDIRQNEHALAKLKTELKDKLRKNPEPSIVENIIKQMKMLSAGIVKQKAMVKYAENLRAKLFAVQRALKGVNKKVINNINKELNPKKQSAFSKLFTKKNNQNQRNKTLNNLKNILTKKGIKGLNLNNISNYDPKKVAVATKNIEDEFERFMADVEALKRTTAAIATTSSSEQASYLKGMENALTGPEIAALTNNEFESYLINEMEPEERNEILNQMSANNLKKYFTNRAKRNTRKVGTASKFVGNVENFFKEVKGGKSRKALRRGSGTRRRR